MTDGDASRAAVIGVGNSMMGDDGIGPRLIAELEGTVSGFDLIDIGTGGMQLVHVLARYDAVILIDAADMGLPPGECRAFSPEGIVSLKQTRAYSLHDWDLMRSVQISRSLGEAPGRILVFAVQPASVEMREGLSPELEREVPRYVAELRRSIAAVGS